MSSTGGWTKSGGHGRGIPTLASTRRHRWAFLLPDLAFVLGVVTLLYCLLLFGGPEKLFRDSDTGWHIRTGEAILNGSGLPHSDPYSFSRPGAAWFAWEWGSDLWMGVAHRKLGLAGVAALFALAIAASAWLWFRLTWAAGGDFLLACLLVPLMVSTSTLHWLARPHVFGWLLLAATLWAVERATGGLRWWHLAGALAWGSLWANLHASFFLAPLIGLLAALGAWMGPRIWPGDGAMPRSRVRWLVAMSISAAAGSFLNPYGWQLHAHVVRYLLDRELLARVGEFQSFNFHLEGAGQITAMFLVVAGSTALMLARRRLDHFLIAMLFLAGALRSARTLPVLAIAVLPLANGAITAALGRARDLHPRLAGWRDAYLGYSGRLRALDASMSGLVWAPVVMALVFWGASTTVAARASGFPPSDFPVAAAAEVAKLPGQARILAPDKFGGYLIYRFSGTRLVFMDGRSDFYGVTFMKRYIDLIEMRPGWRTALNEYGFTHALVPVNYALAEQLRRDGWKSLFEDKTAVLLERPRGNP